MNATSLFNLLCGFIIGYSVFKILDILKQNQVKKEVGATLSELKNNVNKLKNNLDTPSSFTLNDSTNIFEQARDTLINALGMPANKVLLYKEGKALTIAYGTATLITLEEPMEKRISIAVGTDLRIKISNEDKQKEVEEIINLISDVDFEHTLFTAALATFMIRIAEANAEKYSEIDRQILPTVL